MGKARIDADHRLRAGEKPRELLERQAPRDVRHGQPTGDASRAHAFRFIARGKHDAPRERAAELDPALLGPELVGAARHREEHRIGRFTLLRRRHFEAVIGRHIELVAERRGAEQTIALHRMQAACDRVAPMVEARGEWLARARRVHAVASAERARGDERALHERLRIDDRVVALDAHGASEVGDLTPGRTLPPARTPAAQRHRDHAAHRGVHRRDAGERLLDDPVDLGAGELARRVAHRGQVMHHVAERRGLDEEDLKRRRKPFRISGRDFTG